MRELSPITPNVRYSTLYTINSAETHGIGEKSVFSKRSMKSELPDIYQLSELPPTL